MLFNSLEFLVFFPAVLIALGLSHRSWLIQRVIFLAASYWFYMAWNPPFVLLLIGSTVLDFYCARAIAAAQRPRLRRALLVASCAANLGVLVFFKYGNFLLSNALAWTSYETPLESFFANLVLPMGISFYTFQTMSYTIDVYRRQIEPETSLLNFAVYVAFFPQLVAGPILRAADFLPQLITQRTPSADGRLMGLDRMARGCFKKVVIADGLAAYVDMVYADPGAYGAWNHWLAAYAYAFQIYCDFSGYSDIAIGLGLFLGFRFMENFRSPYLAQGPSDFWQRWHISLSTWLRDYLYIPLGGSRGGTLFTYRNLFLTMLLGGLWHGAAWNFVIWGAFHGAWLILHRALVRDRSLPVPSLVSIAFTFHLVCIGWVCFRAESIEKLGVGLRQLADVSAAFVPLPADASILLAIGALSHVLGGSPHLAAAWGRAFFGVKALWYAVAIFVIMVRASDAQRFIYFQF